MTCIVAPDMPRNAPPILRDVGNQTFLSPDSPIPHDLVFEVDGERVYGHTQILALSSTYLRTFLYGPFPPEKTDNGMTMVRVEDFSMTAIQNMIWFVYASLDHSNYNLFDNESEITDEDEMKVALETYRAADYYHIPGLISLCGEAIGRIKVSRANFEWLESFLQPGTLEEKLNQNVVLVKKYVDELEKRRSGDKSELDQEFKDKSDQWINHEIDCSDCSEVELIGAGFYQDGVYQKSRSYNGRPTYVMVHGWQTMSVDQKELLGQKVSLLYFTGTHWVVESKRRHTYYDLNEDSYVVKFEDSSYHNGPPVYTASVNGISLKCGSRPICEKVTVTGRADLEGIYIAQNEYKHHGVKIFTSKIDDIWYRNIWMSADGFRIADAAYSDEHNDGPKKMCPCQATTWRYIEDNVSESLEVTCSSVNCLCQYHN